MPSQKVRRLRVALLARQQQRRSKGKLSDLLVTPKIRDRYNLGLLFVFGFWRTHDLVPQTLAAVDPSFESFSEACWAEGEPYSLVSDALAGLQFFLPSVRKHVHRSWKLLRVWHRQEPANRAVPFSPLLLLGFAGLCVALHNVEAAAFLLVGFDTFARSGELFAIQKAHVTFAKGKAIIRLPVTKTTVRKGAAEMLIVESSIAVHYLAVALAEKPDFAPLLSMSPQRFRVLFALLKDFFNVDDNLSLYSLRRGGATWDFLRHGSMERTLLRGRWQSTSSARIYLQDAVAAVSLLKLTEEQETQLRICSQYLSA